MAKATTKPKDETSVEPMDEAPPAPEQSPATPEAGEDRPAPVDPYEVPPEPVKIGLEATVKEIVDAIKGVDEGVKQALVGQAGRFETVRSHRPDGTPVVLRRNIDTGAQTLLE